MNIVCAVIIENARLAFSIEQLRKFAGNSGARVIALTSSSAKPLSRMTARRDLAVRGGALSCCGEQSAAASACRDRRCCARHEVRAVMTGAAIGETHAASVMQARPKAWS